MHPILLSTYTDTVPAITAAANAVINCMILCRHGQCVLGQEYNRNPTPTPNPTPALPYPLMADTDSVFWDKNQ